MLHIHNTYKIVALTPLPVPTPPRSLYWDFQDDLKMEKLTTKGLYGVFDQNRGLQMWQGFVAVLWSFWVRYGAERGVKKAGMVEKVEGILRVHQQRELSCTV